MSDRPTIHTFVHWFCNQFPLAHGGGFGPLLYHRQANYALIYREFTRLFGKRAWKHAVEPGGIPFGLFEKMRKSLPRWSSENIYIAIDAMRHLAHRFEQIRSFREITKCRGDEMHVNGDTLHKRRDKVVNSIMTMHLQRGVRQYACGNKYKIEYVKTLDECSVVLTTRKGRTRLRRGTGFGIREAFAHCKVMAGISFTPLLVYGPECGRMHMRVHFGGCRWPYHTACIGAVPHDIRHGRQVWIVKTASPGRGSDVNHAYLYAVLINNRWQLGATLRQLDGQIVSLAAGHFANHIYKDVLASCGNDRITLNACWHEVSGKANEFLASGVQDTHEFLGLDIPRYWELPKFTPF